MPRPEPNSPSYTAAIEVRRSAVHGRGVFAVRELPPGTVIGMYVGQRYTPDEVGRKAWDSAITYLFGLSDGTVIDGALKGNATRHLNHACEPNCEAIESYSTDGQLVLHIETIRPVDADDELFLDYALVVDATDDPAHYPCRCGATRCRGTLVAAVDD